MHLFDANANKGFRLLNIYERLNRGELISKDQLAQEYGTSAKTIQRDIDDLRIYLAETHFTESEIAIQYDKRRNGYYLIRFEREWLTNEEVLALCKILLESRAFELNELKGLIDKLLTQVAPADRQQVVEIIRNEHFHYIPLKHGKPLLSPLWQLSRFINQKEVVSFDYMRKDGVATSRIVKPVAILFSEYYFYLIAFLSDDSKEFPTVFRIDRISNIKTTKQQFHVPYKDRFDDGEFRKRVQFMFSGELRTVHFEYSGPSIEAVLDRLPTAQIVKESGGIYTISAEVYGTGIDMWLRSQGDMVKVL